MANEKITIVVTQTGATRVKKEIGGIDTAAQKASRGVGMLKTALAGISVALIGRELISIADGATQLQNTVDLANSSLQGFNVTTDDLYNIANRSRQSVNDLSGLFRRAAMSADELGASQAELLQFTELTAKAISVQGISAAQARGPLLQLAQGLGAGIFRAEEFNSILEGAPFILQAVAQGMDGAGGSVAKLRQMMKEGNVASSSFFEALLSQADFIEDKFAQTKTTIGQAFTVLRSEIQRTLASSEIFQAGIQAIVGALEWAALNVDAVVMALSGLAAIVTAIAIGGVLYALVVGVQTLVGAFIALNLAILANPLILLGAAIVGIVAYLVLFTDTVETVIGAWSSFVEFLSDSIDVIKEFFSDLWESFISAANSAVSYVIAIFTNMGRIFSVVVKGWVTVFQTAFSVIGQAVSNFFSFFIGLWQSGVELVAQAVVGMVAAFVNGWNSIRDWFSGLWSDIAGFVQKGVAKAMQFITNLISSIQRAITMLKQLLGMQDKAGIGGDISTSQGSSNASNTQDAGAFRTGGSFTVGGSGGEDSQSVNLRASPGERITVESPTQVRNNDAKQAPIQNKEGDIAITNVVDPNAMLNTLSTATGKRVIKNIIQSDAKAFAAILGAAAVAG